LGIIAMQLSDSPRLQLWVPTVFSWMAYPAVGLLPLLGEGPNGTWLGPSMVTAAWAVVGVALAATKTYRRIGVGLLIGLVLGLVTVAVVLFIGAVMLASEIGYS
jgi:hypothetical protein